MNLYFRLFWVLLFARFKSTVSIMGATYRSWHRVWLNDLDLLGHMNNGRFFTITDYVRLEMLIRAGLWRYLRKERMIPVLAGETAQFRKSLKPFQRYAIDTQLLGWDERFFYLEHRFHSRGEVYALVIVKVCFLGPGKPSPASILRLIYPDANETRMDEMLSRWNESSKAHWQEHRADERV